MKSRYKVIRKQGQTYYRRHIAIKTGLLINRHGELNQEDLLPTTKAIYAV
jgi:hypothetical protein